jgi:ZIP zinc transporter
MRAAAGHWVAVATSNTEVATAEEDNDDLPRAQEEPLFALRIIAALERRAVKRAAREASARDLTTLLQIVVAALSGGVFATVAAAGTLVLHRGWISRIVSFAVGALLGAVFLELLPHALEEGDTATVMATVLAGLLAFFALEKLVLWRHAHGHDEHEDEADESEHAHALHAHGVDEGRSGLMILIGTSVHNFCDGVVIAASFLAGTSLGVATTVAIVAHAVPQQVGDFAVLSIRDSRGAAPCSTTCRWGLPRSSARLRATSRSRRWSRRCRSRSRSRRRACSTWRSPISFPACTAVRSRSRRRSSSCSSCSASAS